MCFLMVDVCMIKWCERVQMSSKSGEFYAKNAEIHAKNCNNPVWNP